MWKILYDFIMLLAAICGIIFPALAFVGINSFKDIQQGISLQKIIGGCIISATILLIIIIIFYIAKNIKQRKKLSKLHAVFHKIRNSIVDVWNFDTNNSNYEIYVKECKYLCSEICSSIHEFFYKNNRKKLGICIKTFPTDLSEPSDPIEIKNAEVITFCRAGENAEKRKEKDEKTTNKNLVKDNTVFDKIIFEKDKDYYACSNLLMLNLLARILSNKDIYKNSNPEFIKEYKSTISVPIRIKDALDVDYPVKKEGYSIIGFLCVDYKHPLSAAQKDEICEYTKAIADSLGILMYEMRNKSSMY